MIKLTSERKLVQSIIDKKGLCWHINCDGGTFTSRNLGRTELPEWVLDYSNVGISCPFREECKNMEDDDKVILKQAKSWMKEYKKNLKKNKETN